MPESKLLGYKSVFGFVLPDWVSEKMVKNTIYGLLVLAAMFLTLIFVVWPNLTLAQSRQASLIASKSSLEILKKSKTSLDRLASDISNTDQTKILTAIPQEYSPEEAIFHLRKIGANTGVSIVSYTLPPGIILDTTKTADQTTGTDMVSFTAFPVHITVAARVGSLLRFISLVESSLPFGNVSDLNIQDVVSKLSQTAGEKTVQMVLEIRFYQSILGKVNLTKLQEFTEADLKLVADLRGYNLITIPEAQPSIETGPLGSGKIFGF
ncbi:hypothetical protein COT86_00070 [Candidatus Collierbacteria bacterium CG10_big_fil_rev_8_21_14_0_10_43_36]|uniref:Uncharacterized protein n=2 Tax=Candidatus Collieribacteriota TaxID=1752725 RepID=A0A2H0DTV1_9BACT|nr:hypothetical protein [bacterium]PIP85298.1 MAG: hypothetical protein COW83_05035 [Candidatus Collierbacteria bacterium CG22_combo_CG10-13_8_21_14_all_43_12]PIS00153.1 MAG: hypothetical protein COT86_00070 [Candidatus Collierbacteria bacterium CG10_big_fil_rev_8_21_14_0_10_43_36]